MDCNSGGGDYNIIIDLLVYRRHVAMLRYAICLRFTSSDVTKFGRVSELSRTPPESVRRTVLKVF